MTTNSSNQPNRQPQPNGYNPITLEDVQKPAPSMQCDYFGELTSPIARCMAAPLLFFIFLFSYGEPFLAPLALLVLLGCLLVRLDKYPRQIAAVPLTLATIKLAFQMESYLSSSLSNARVQQNFSMDPGFIWLPMFYSACLIFIPRRDSVTFKLILAGSCVLLASGLLPGPAFVGIFYLLDGMLFLAMVVGIFVDMKNYMAPQAQTNPRPAL
jgi:hypothetical protein